MRFVRENGEIVYLIRSEIEINRRVTRILI